MGGKKQLCIIAFPTDALTGGFVHLYTLAFATWPQRGVGGSCHNRTPGI
jgi:hypothetical protein